MDHVQIMLMMLRVRHYERKLAEIVTADLWIRNGARLYRRGEP